MAFTHNFDSRELYPPEPERHERCTHPACGKSIDLLTDDYVEVRWDRFMHTACANDIDEDDD